MDVYDFHTWLSRRRQQQRQHIPAADKVVPLVAQAGHQGLSRSEIGKSVDLEREELDRLLAGLVEFGLLSVTVHNGLQIFRHSGRLNFTTPEKSG